MKEIKRVVKSFYSPSAEGFDEALVFEDSIEIDNRLELLNEASKTGKVIKTGHKGLPILVRPGKTYEVWNSKKENWYITPEKYAELESIENARALQEKKDAYYAIENTITRLERIRDRNDSEQAELDELIDESTKLFREIRAEKEKLNDRNA